MKKILGPVERLIAETGKKPTHDITRHSRSVYSFISQSAERDRPSSPLRHELAPALSSPKG